MYQLIDSGNFQKLEQVGPYRVVRPAAQAVWRPRLDADAWRQVDAYYTRFTGGDGRWTRHNRQLPDSWAIPVPSVGQMLLKLTDFGHLGIFPEQHANWARLSEIVAARRGDKPFQVLNLFAYTGGSSLACARAGATVVHCDASRTSVSWAKDNAVASGLGEQALRWMVDDVQKFVAREVRRGSRYQGIILDPPSFGRGPKGETWKIEEMLPPLLDSLKQLCADDLAFVLLSAHSEGYTPLALTNVLSGICSPADGTLTAEEMVVREEDSLRALPSGASCLYVSRG